MPITIAEDNFIGEPGVQSIPMGDPEDPMGVNPTTDLTPIKDRTIQQYSGSWNPHSWAAILDGILYYKHIGKFYESPPDWATHIYKPH